MKLLVLACVVTVALAQMSPERKAAYTDALSRDNSLQPEWHLPHEEGYEYTEKGAMEAIRSGVQKKLDKDGNEYTEKRNTGMLGGRDKKGHATADTESNTDGGTSDVKDLYVSGEFNKEDSVNMTPYVIQTKDERWQAGIPNYESPEEGYLVQTFDAEADARSYVIDKTGADLEITYPLAPDVDPEFNLANQSNPDDKNPNTMQDNAPTTAPVKQLGHMEPAYVGEYDDKEIFGDTHSDKVSGTAEGKDHGDLQKAIYLESASSVRQSLKGLRLRK